MAQERKHARDVMTRNPECVSERDSIRDVARIMKDTDTGVVPVVDGKKIVGLITDRDIVVRGLADGKNLENASVRDLMTRQVKSVREDAPIDEVLNVMTSAEIRRVTVVNANDELVGIVSIGDISKNTTKD
ncbi:MAG TPA: CBS domain-containing protein, partial [Thermoanaerobaculia bacterium]|nr:CBS domain-containing protein [Thermoanaerobaculia bacterium]